MKAGIDYSMTSPAICVGGEKFFYFPSTKKTFHITKKLHAYDYVVWNTPEERFEKLSSWALDILLSNKVDYVALEGYSYNSGSSGSVVFEIGENTGVLKNKLYTNGIKFDMPSPATIKKIAGKGSLTKYAMYESFCKDFGNLLVEHGFNCNRQAKGKLASPASDIVDSYFLWKWANEGNIL